MQISEMKVDCKLKKDGQSIDAMLHLIEIRYNERLVFWNGVAQLTDDQVEKLGGPLKPPVIVEVKLPNEQTGFLHLTHFRGTSGYFEVAGVGKPNG